jgi:glyoxylase-like metal-dependent hydrolase (beta-lactamase superfamily II)
MKIKQFTFNAFSENTYVAYDETLACVIIDAGCSNTLEQNELLSFIGTQNLCISALIQTHGHIDHVMGLSFLVTKFNAPLSAHIGDEFLMQQAPQMAARYGLQSDLVPEITQYLSETDTISFGNSTLKILHVPGHSPGSLVFWSEADNFVVVGDVLFGGSIGRTDLPGGNYEQLIEGIQTKLMTLPDKTIVYSGHGAPTTIGKERISNPFLV